jgi:hypothetical protein
MWMDIFLTKCKGFSKENTEIVVNKLDQTGKDYMTTVGDNFTFHANRIENNLRKGVKTV